MSVPTDLSMKLKRQFLGEVDAFHTGAGVTGYQRAVKRELPSILHTVCEN